MTSLILFLAVWGPIGLGGLQARAQDEIVPGRDLPVSLGRMDFDQCVKYSLKESPVLTTSTVDIELKRLDESDSRYAFIPSFSIRTNYFVNQPNNTLYPDARPYSYGFVTETYNPFEIYFNFRARQVLTKIGKLAHLQVTSDFLERLGKGFLELESLDRIASLQGESVRLAEQGVAYARTRLDAGGISALEIQMAEQEVQLAQAELNKLESARATIVDGLKGMMGLGVHEALSLDVRNARRQVLGDFDPGSVKEEEARRRSFELQIQALKRQLQEKNITVAYTRFLPTFIWGVQTTDPFSGQQEEGLFFSVGFELPIWDGLKRYHNVLRQKQILKQVSAESKTKESSFETRWSAASRGLSDAASSLKIARSQKELAELKVRKSEIGYNAGRIGLTDLLADRKALLDNEKSVLKQDLERDKTALTVRNLSGDLVKNYVDTKIQ